MPDSSKLLANFGPRPGTSLICLSFNGSPVKSRNFCEVVDDIFCSRTKFRNKKLT